MSFLNPSAWNKTLVFFSLLVFLSCQRFYLTEFTANLSIIPMLCVFLFHKRPDMQFYCIFIALILIIDKSDLGYRNSFIVIKYVVYLVCLTFILSKSFPPIPLVIWLIWLILIILITINNSHFIQFSVFLRDFIFAISLLAIGSLHRDGVISQANRLVQLSFWISIGMILSELLNIALFYDYYGGHYLSYSPLKLIICLASLIALIQRKFIVFGILLIPTILILINFQTRMIFIFYILIILLISFKYVKDWFRFTAVVCIGILLAPSEIYSQFRVLNIFYYIVSSDNLLLFFKSLDPIRTAEHQIIFNQDVGKLLFGNGLGVGFYDINGSLDFVKVSDNAFSSEEIKNKLYFRLHDSWIYIAHSFGGIFYLFLTFLNVREFFSKNSSQEQQVIAAFCLLLLNLATYSTSGIILFSILLGYLIQYRQYANFKK